MLKSDSFATEHRAAASKAIAKPIEWVADNFVSKKERMTQEKAARKMVERANVYSHSQFTHTRTIAIIRAAVIGMHLANHFARIRRNE